jgi:hypothetical protein
VIVIFRHFFLCPPLLPLAPFVSSILCEILVYIPGCASIAECQLTIGFKIVCSPVDTHYTVVWRVSKRQKKKRKKRLECRNRTQSHDWNASGCVDIYWAESGPFVPSSFWSFHLSLYFCIFRFYWNVWVHFCCLIPAVFGYVDDLVIFWQFTPSFLSKILPPTVWLWLVLYTNYQYYQPFIHRTLAPVTVPSCPRLPAVQRFISYEPAAHRHRTV